MSNRRDIWRGLLSLLAGTALSRAAKADTAPTQISPTGGPGQEMLTIFLRHDQTKTVDEINQHLKQTGWFAEFPPADVEVVSWYVLMGSGRS